VSFFEVDVQQGNSMILWLFLQVFVFFFLEKIISSTISKIVDFGKKTQGISRVKVQISEILVSICQNYGRN
jgi:hypothetical protein